MTRVVAAGLVVMAALVLLFQGAGAQTQCSATQECADRANCCSAFGYCGTGSDYCGTGCTNGPCSTTPGGGAGGTGWSSFVTAAVFDSIFPSRNAFYTYEGLQTAAAAPYADFGTSGQPDDQKRELAAFLANIKHESGGLVYTVEQNPIGIYCDIINYPQFPCASGKTYIGRGPIQLSWNYNYGACGIAIGKPLLEDPDRVARESDTAYQTALWFWMTNGPHGAILGNSFSGTIRSINGDRECNKAVGSEGHNQMLQRVEYYKDICQRLGVDPGTDLTC